MNKRVYISIIPAVLLKLIGGQQAHAFTSDEMLVIEAIKRSDNDLVDANIEEISTYLSQYSSEQLQGISNNVKGIYHEIKFVEAENTDGDDIDAELYELTNHPGADVRLTNTTTGEITNVQLKAANSTHYVGEHLDKYPDINVLATEEVANNLSDVESSGFSNEELSNDVSHTLNEITENGGYIESTATTSGLISAVLNTKAILEGKQSSSIAARKTLEDIGIATASAVIIEVLIG